MSHCSPRIRFCRIRGFFNLLLDRAQLVCTPGVGFGKSGEGYVRLTAFGTPENTAEAIERLSGLQL